MDHILKATLTMARLEELGVPARASLEPEAAYLLKEILIRFLSGGMLKVIDLPDGRRLVTTVDKEPPLVVYC